MKIKIVKSFFLTFILTISLSYSSEYKSNIEEIQNVYKARADQIDNECIKLAQDQENDIKRLDAIQQEIQLKNYKLKKTNFDIVNEVGIEINVNSTKRKNAIVSYNAITINFSRVIDNDPDEQSEYFIWHVPKTDPYWLYIGNAVVLNNNIPNHIKSYVVQQAQKLGHFIITPQYQKTLRDKLTTLQKEKENLEKKCDERNAVFEKLTKESEEILEQLKKEVQAETERRKRLRICPICKRPCLPENFCKSPPIKEVTQPQGQKSNPPQAGMQLNHSSQINNSTEKKLVSKENKQEIKNLDENQKLIEKRAQEEGKKQVEEKLKQNEPLTREEDEQFNEGKERKAEIEEYIEKLNLEGKEQIAKAMQEFLKNPREALLSQEVRDYFGKGVQQFNYGTEDLVDNSIVDAIDNSTKILKQLERPGILNSNFIVEQLKQSLVMGDTALAKQADFLSSKNSVEAALNTTSLINSISNLAQGFFTGVYERGCEIANTIYSAGAKVIGAITHMATHPQAMLEKVGCLMMEAESPDILNAMCEVSPVIAQKRKEAMQSVDNKVYKPIEASIESAANFVGKVGNNLIEFSKEYGAAFYTSEDFLGLPEQTCKSMLSEQQHCQQKLKEAINTYAQKVTAEGVGKVAGSVAADIGAFYLGEKIVGTVANKIGGTVSSSAKAETLAATAREVEVAALPSISPAVQKVPIITEELSGSQKVIEEIYNYNHAQEVQQALNNQIAPSSVQTLEHGLTAERTAHKSQISKTSTSYTEAELINGYSPNPISQEPVVDKTTWLAVSDKPILEEKPPISLFPPQNHKLSFTYNDIETARWQAKARIKEFCKFYLQKINNILPCALTKEAGTVIIEAFEATGSPLVIQEGLEKTLNTFCNGVKKYNTVPGFSENITKKIIAAKHSKGYSLSNINGCIGEIQCANKLESIGETIVEFGKKIKGKYSSADFDVVTTTKVFESKNFSNWSTINLNSLRDQLGREAQIAAEYGKSLGLYSTNPIPESFKEWLIKKNILILEG